MPQQDQVVLTPGTNQSGGFEWQMGVNGAAPQGPPYPAINVAKGNTADITFSIQNAPDVTFSDNPILVPPGAKIDITPLQPTSFTVTDHNVKQGQVPYVLMFNGAPIVDPIINNDGGGHIVLQRAAFGALGAIALIGIGALVLSPIFRERSAVERQRRH